MALDLVLFDLDGTLLDTAPEIADATNDTLQAMGLPGVDDASIRQWIGHGAMQLLAKALGQGWGVSPTPPFKTAVGLTHRPFFVRLISGAAAPVAPFTMGYRPRCKGWPATGCLWLW